MDRSTFKALELQIEKLKALKLKSLKLPTLKDTVLSLIHLPEKFARYFKQHVWLLLPLLATQLLQKFQDLVDDRFISTLGRDALSIHNVQYSLFLIGQELGLAAATSALIFWKRKESEGKQGSILCLHLLMPFVISSAIATVLFFFLHRISEHFKIPIEFAGNAHTYLSLGLINLVLRSLYVPLSAILIANEMRYICTLIAALILLAKYVLGSVAVAHYWNLQGDPASISSPMTMIGVGSLVIFAVAIVLAFVLLTRTVDGWKKIDFKSIAMVWPGELGIAMISATSPLIFGFQIAKVHASMGFFVTYQLALHFTYIITLPVLAGIQIAVRDCSAEQSDHPELNFTPLNEAHWWPHFFYASIVPTCILLLLAMSFAKPIFLNIYKYQIPQDHLVFLPFFYFSWVLWQFGSIYLIMLRAAKKNGLATRNFVVAGLGVQVGVTQILISYGYATPVTVGIVFLAYCSTYLLLNWQAISQIQSKYYLFKYRDHGIQIPIIKMQLILPKKSREKSISVLQNNSDSIITLEVKHD